MIQLFGCTAKDRGDITYFHYDSHGTAMGSTVSYEATLLDDGTVSLNVIRGAKDETYICGAEVMKDLGRMADKYKIKRLRRYYRPPVKVLDGSSWGLKVKYSSGAEVVSGGYVRRPERCRELMEEVETYFSQWASVPSADKVERFYYSYGNGMIMNSGHSYSAYIDRDGLTKIILDEERPTEKIIRTPDRRILTDLARVIKEYGVYKYKGFYHPDTDVRDGSDWRLSADWPDGGEINAHGYVVKPEGGREAFRALEKCFEFWREIPVPASGEVTTAEIEAFLGDWGLPEGELTSFRYELYLDGKCAVYYLTFNSEYKFETAYRRRYGEYEGWNYMLPYDDFASEVAEMVKDARFRFYPQTQLDKEDKSRDRWLAEVEYSSGEKVQIVNNIDVGNKEEAEALRAKVTAFLDARFGRIGEDIRPTEYSRTTYSPDGRRLKRIDYTGDGIVHGGQDYTATEPVCF